MAGSVTIKALGLARFSARLSKRRQATDALLVDASNEGAAIVTSTAKSIVAVRDGVLRESIHPIPAEQKNGSVTSGAATGMEYAPYVEFGTGVRGNGSYPYSPEDISLSYGDRPGQVAQPYMYPALDQNKEKIRKLFRLAVIKAGVGGR